MNKYQIIKKLGRGAAGDVFLGKNKSTGEQVALKEISTTVERPQITSETMKEVELMKSLAHPNVVGYIDSFKDSGKLYIAMEYVDGGDLSKFIEDRNGRLLSEEDVLKIFIQIVIGLKYIHDRKVVHRDLKPQNIFMTRVGVVKLGDFGVSKELACTQDLCQTQIGTPYYLSPEVWNNEPYNTQTDIWAAGCILYELCTLKRPFGGQNINQLLVNVIQGKFQPLTSRFSSDLRDLVSSMLNQNPSARPTASEILAMPFITSRLCSMIRENESQLKTVNIIEHKTKKRKRKVASPKKGVKKPAKKQNEPELIGADTALPLPEEDLPKWAQRILDGGQQLGDSGTLVPEDEDKSDSDWNEWDELDEATIALHESLSLSQGRAIADANMNEEQIREEIESLRAKLESKLGKGLADMLCRNVEAAGEERDSARQFLEIMEMDDQESVNDAKRLHQLEEML